MTKVKNITNGPKGIRNSQNIVVTLEPGQSEDIDLADGEDSQTDWFEFGGKSASSDEPGPLDLSIPKLTEYLAGVDDADEVQKLIDAETAGKSRDGALAALEARRDELLA